MQRRHAGWSIVAAAMVGALACGDGTPAAPSPVDAGGAGTPAPDGAADQPADRLAPDPPSDANRDLPLPVDVANTDVARDVAPADLPISGCLVLAQQVTVREAPLVVGPPPPPWMGDPSRLTPQEIVGRLARFLWRTEPDAALLARVEGCMRLTVNDVLVLAEWMLRDPRAARSIQAFVAWWLELDRLAGERRDPALFPLFSEDLRRSMAQEPLLFAAHVVFNDSGTLPRLLTAPYTFVDRHLGAVYDRPGGDDTFQRIDFTAADQRAGILTQPGVLAVSGGFDRHSGPRRALRLLERVLCTPVPPEPAGISPEIPPPSARPGQSLRQAMEMSFSEPVCAACHALLQVGFAFEPFDAIGRRRTMDNGAAIDSRVRLVDPRVGGEKFLAGPIELGSELADSQTLPGCFASRWLEFAIGRPVSDRDQHVVEGLRLVFTRANLDIRHLVAQVAISAPFLALP